MAYKFVYVCSFFMLLKFRGVPADIDHGEATLTYKSDNFATEIAKNKHFVMFYAPWCGHCKRLSPTWNELAKIYNKDVSVSPVIVAKVDCTTDTSVCAEHDITGYPTIKFFKDKTSSVRYKGNRDLDSLQRYVESQLNPESEEGDADAKGSDREKWLVELDDATFEKHIETGQHFVKFYAPWCGHCQKLAPVWEELASTFQFNDKVTIAKIDCMDSKTVCTIQNIQAYPTLLWFKNGMMVERYNGGRSHEDLKAFVSEMLEKEDPELLRTDDMIEVNTPQSQAAVLDLTEENFEDVLTDGHVFVKFFAPWCGHCKRLAPTWEDLSKKFSDTNEIKIAEVDCTKHTNLCKAYQIRGYPTLILYHSGEKIAEYVGSRTLEDMHSFVLEHLEAKRDEL